ncbi:bifunctional DNA-formamidopyrimidine glycosylase/DNA-(apurinic or apyrimidinic site) lyase [Zoogloea sp.]|uniref:bifunctional DNA-formamidopyrimidine glycosylase/DNA-(apurinic or apyrimidinic site) lyase n=1 Tax=Zoogloea sp. TaxID=49181 RepID=UPI00263A2DED|nr:bifunctional DNA-formamidopyrimidine glycosylase/DNA-(apurinic or apyrimidinic site) lyase [Zoogloea sp.]MDD3355131.1 bifunctional DNA-formamidopyrimidine glycosylase/DNA-(apurinic or apyrimidinic site) lyase [Zoogloea sp.]
MPELPEVETTRRGIAPELEGQQVTAVLIRNGRLRQPVPASLAQHLAEQPLQRVRRRAKYLLLDFPAGSLLIHLGMSGSLRIVPADQPPEKHDHVDIVFGARTLRLRDPRRFGLVLWQDGETEHPLLTRLGIEPLSDGFDGAWLHRASRGRRTPAKLFIMDGSIVVGIGNIYASESLFRAGIDPTTPMDELGLRRCTRLASCIRETLSDALAAGGSTLRDFVSSTGTPGYFQQSYFVYGRDGEPCRRCGTLIRKRIMGQRASFHCPRCQR